MWTVRFASFPVGPNCPMLFQILYILCILRVRQIEVRSYEMILLTWPNVLWSSTKFRGHCLSRVTVRQCMSYWFWLHLTTSPFGFMFSDSQLWLVSELVVTNFLFSSKQCAQKNRSGKMRRFLFTTLQLMHVLYLFAFLLKWAIIIIILHCEWLLAFGVTCNEQLLKINYR